MPGHRFRVIALDGNAVPSPNAVPIVDVSPGERVDAIVEMSNAGVWWLGEVRNDQRDAGMRIAIEYAGQSGQARWSLPAPFTWDYGTFASSDAAPAPDATTSLVVRAEANGHEWTINGKGYPRTDPIVVRDGTRHRIILDNQSADDHPVHLHRHTFEVVKIGDRRMSGIMKDVVVVPAWKQAEIDVRAVNPGLSLFHCHQQFHMDMGFMTMLKYA
jgi:FtsP/CotA-like multicopper oxidase with cupredoxin domain